MSLLQDFYSPLLHRGMVAALVAVHLTGAADWLDLGWLLVSLGLLPFFLVPLSAERSSRLGRMLPSLLLGTFLVDRVGALNRLSGFGMDPHGALHDGLVGLVSLGLVLVLTAACGVGLVSRCFRCAAFSPVVFALWALPVWDVAPVVSRQLVAQRVHGVDTTDRVVTKLPAGLDPIVFGYHRPGAADGPYPMVNGILLPSGSQTQTVRLNPLLHWLLIGYGSVRGSRPPRR